MAYRAGYGSFTPLTAVGKGVTMVYAGLGIPLMLLYLSAVGGLLARCARGVFTRAVCCCLCSKCGYCCYDEERMLERERRLRRQRQQQQQQRQELSAVSRTSGSCSAPTAAERSGFGNSLVESSAFERALSRIKIGGELHFKLFRRYFLGVIRLFEACHHIR